MKKRITKTMKKAAENIGFHSVWLKEFKIKCEESLEVARKNMVETIANGEEGITTYKDAIEDYKKAIDHCTEFINKWGKDNEHYDDAKAYMSQYKSEIERCKDKISDMEQNIKTIKKFLVNIEELKAEHLREEYRQLNKNNKIFNQAKIL